MQFGTETSFSCLPSHVWPASDFIPGPAAAAETRLDPKERQISDETTRLADKSLGLRHAETWHIKYHINFQFILCQRNPFHLAWTVYPLHGIMVHLRAALQALLPVSTFLPCFAAASSNPFEALNRVPRGWTRIKSAEPTEKIKLRVSLKQQNLDQFYDSLLQVSTPNHPQYGKHYQGHELRSLLRPSDEASATAISWLQDNNVTDVQDDGEYLMFRTTVGTANTLLDTQFDWYRGEDGMQMMRTTGYSVPQEVAAHINFVQPTTRFGTAKRLASHVNFMDAGARSDGTSRWVSAPNNLKINATNAVDPACNSTITPRCLFQLYNINFKGHPACGNTAGYASFVGESARFTDMTMFEQVYAPFAADRNVSHELVARYGCTVSLVG